ncbi:DEAD/DEAH box helicase [Natrialbaceae archaeon A-chndr2]
MQEENSTYEIASDFDVFNDCLDALTINLIKTDLGVKKREQTGFEAFREDAISKKTTDGDIQQSAWIASVLASSNDDKHKRKALSFGILAYLRYQGTNQEPLYERYLYIILSRVGNLPAFNNVRRESQPSFESQLINSLDSVLGLELESNLNEYGINKEKVFSEFQKEIFDLLVDKKDVAISGPTSSGKSFVLQEYLDYRVNIEQNFEVIYVVPTRALISEVSRELSTRYEEIEVRTGAYFKNNDIDESDDGNTDVFLVVTPERCLRLLDPETRHQIDPDLVFLDEVQNVEEDQRGVLFESIIESLAEYYSSAQIVAAGPYLDNPAKTLESITDRDAEEITTAFTPILQLKTTLRFISQKSKTNRNLELAIHSPSGSTRTVCVPEPEDMTYSEVKGNKKKSLQKIIETYGKDSKNLIYSARKDYAEDRASHIASFRERQTVETSVQNLIDFLADAIHEEYSLINCLRKGVAYHHGMVPKIAREEIEQLYGEIEFLDTIVTTPTLMQGVNLPAEKIFLVSANRGQEKLTDFEFNNLIGRVGRLDTKLYGAIYCIETEGDEWADEKLDNNDKKEIESATSKATNDTEQLIKALQHDDLTQIENEATKYTSILLRGRYLKNRDSVATYLQDKGLNQEDIKAAEKALQATLEKVQIPQAVLRRNPTVDPVKQNTLYRNITQNPESWIVAANRHEYSYDQFESITRQLNSIFKFTNDPEIGIKPEIRESENWGIGPIIYAGNEWLRGYNYNSIITGRQESDVVDDGDINTSIRKALQTVRTDIRFVLVKYYGILTTLLEHIDTDVPDWMLRFDQMLEMGSMRYNQIKLMSMGVDRSVAVSLRIPDDVDDVTTYLQENSKTIPSFYQRHLQNQGIL